MKAKSKTSTMLIVINIISWLLFVAVCVEAGVIIVGGITKMVVDPSQHHKLWQEPNMSDLYNYDPGYFLMVIILIGIVAILRTIIFYRIVKILNDRKRSLDLSRPFSTELQRFASLVGWLAIGTGLFSSWAVRTTEWLVSKGVTMPDIQKLRVGGADVWIFMGVTLLVMSHIIKRGIEIQTENDLTV